jgi:hypothetical protein
MRVQKTTPPLTAPPVLRITGKTLKEFQTAMIKVYIEDGWTKKEQSEHQMIFVKEINDRSARRWYASSANNPAFVREEVVFWQEEGMIKATTYQEVVATFGSVTRTEPVTNYEAPAERFARVESSLTAPESKTLVGNLSPNWFTVDSE